MTAYWAEFENRCRLSDTTFEVALTIDESYPNSTIYAEPFF